MAWLYKMFLWNPGRKQRPRRDEMSLLSSQKYHNQGISIRYDGRRIAKAKSKLRMMS